MQAGAVRTLVFMFSVRQAASLGLNLHCNQTAAPSRNTVASQSKLGLKEPKNNPQNRQTHLGNKQALDCLSQVTVKGSHGRRKPLLCFIVWTLAVQGFKVPNAPLKPNLMQPHECTGHVIYHRDPRVRAH